MYMEGSQYQNKLTGIPYLRMVCLKNNSLAQLVKRWITLSNGRQYLFSRVRPALFSICLPVFWLLPITNLRKHSNLEHSEVTLFILVFFSLRLKNLLQKNLTSLLEVTIKKLSLPQQKGYTCLRSVWNLSSMTK